MSYTFLQEQGELLLELKVPFRTGKDLQKL